MSGVVFQAASGRPVDGLTLDRHGLAQAALSSSTVGAESSRGSNAGVEEPFVRFAGGAVEALEGHLVEFFGDGVQVGLVVGIIRFMWCAWPAKGWRSAANGFNKTPLGHRGRRGDLLFQARRRLHTGEALLTDRHRERLMALFTPDDHAQVEATWGAYQRIITAYREPDPHQGNQLVQTVIDSLREGVPTVLIETRKLGRTLNKRADDPTWLTLRELADRAGL